MLELGICTLIGFETQPKGLEKLKQMAGPLEEYLPYAIGDSGTHSLRFCSASGMTSLLRPNPATLDLFNRFSQFGEGP